VERRLASSRNASSQNRSFVVGSRRSFSARVLAGVGNYLRSEILFDAKLHPDRTPSDLDEAELRSLARSVRSISNRTYRQRGICTEPPLYRTYVKKGELVRETREEYWASL
jgi:formamidopyrimidine-DNA glycosylase